MRDDVGVLKFAPTCVLMGEVIEWDFPSREPDESEDNFNGSCCLTGWPEGCGFFEAVELKDVPLEDTDNKKEKG